MASRTPHPNPPGRDPVASRNLGDPPATEPYPLKRGGRAVPDRSRPPDIGAACHDTRKVSPPVAETEDLRSGVEFGSTRGNTKVQKTAQEHGDAMRESRGVITRPVRPGQHW
jgi:hypothetical protein